MPSIASSEVVVPQTLSPAARQQLTNDLYAVHCQIFDGADQAAFARAIMQSKAPHNPLVVRVGWRTRDTEAERAYWHNSEKPAARFFVQTNPNYNEGNALMVLVPLSGGALPRIAGRFIADQVRLRAEAALVAAHHLPLIGPLIAGGDIRRRLKRTALFADVPDGDLRLVARAAEVRVLPAGRPVLREGEAGTDLYVIATGSVYVLVDRGGEERLIDQLAAGEMFGEIAMLSGEPRGASIRTARKTTLIRLERKALLPLMESHPLMREAIWGAFAFRRFELTAGSSTRFGALTRRQRQEWFARGQLQQLTEGEGRTIAGMWIFLITGSVEINRQGSWLTTRAPALIEAGEPLELLARAQAWIALLPQEIHP